MPFEGVSTVQFISEYRSLLSGLHLNYWLLWGQSKHAANQQIWNHADSLFDRQICCLCCVQTSDFCFLSSENWILLRLCVGFRAQLSETKECQKKSSSSSPLANQLFSMSQKTSIRICWCVTWHGRKSIFRRKRTISKAPWSQQRASLVLTCLNPFWSALIVGGEKISSAVYALCFHCSALNCSSGWSVLYSCVFMSWH